MSVVSCLQTEATVVPFWCFWSPLALPFKTVCFTLAIFSAAGAQSLAYTLSGSHVYGILRDSFPVVNLVEPDEPNRKYELRR